MVPSVAYGLASDAWPDAVRLVPSDMTRVRLRPALLTLRARNLIHGTPDLSRCHSRSGRHVWVAGAVHAATTATAPGLENSSGRVTASHRADSRYHGSRCTDDDGGSA